MQEVDWTEILEKTPGDVCELRVCADWYEDQDQLLRSQEIREKAAFWLWVEENHYQPYLSQRKLYGWIRLENNDKPLIYEGKIGNCLPNKIFHLLPKDTDGDLPRLSMSLLLYGPQKGFHGGCTNTKQSLKDTWQALFTAWLAWREQCKK